MLNIAHRGFSGKYPENTMVAFKKAVEAGADAMEFDVHLTKDGQVVIIHDERLDRTTNGTGYVRDYTLKELKETDASYWLQGKSGKVDIPTLREYFDWVKDYPILSNIELKTGIYSYPGIEKKVDELIREYQLENRVLISSFNHRSLMRFRELNPEIPIGVLVDVWMVHAETYLLSLGAEYYHPSAYGVTKEEVEALGKYNIGINPWFYNNEILDYEKVIDLEVNGIITNDPDQIKAILDERDS